MGVLMLLKQIRAGKGDVYIECDECEMICLASKSGLDIRLYKEDCEVPFICERCTRIKELEDRLVEGKICVCDKSEGKCPVVKDASTITVERSKTLVIPTASKEVDYVTQGIVLGDSMVRHVGNDVSRVKRRITRCCMPGAKVKDLIGEVQKGAVKAGDKTVLWVGTNNVGSSNNVEFKKDVGELLGVIKAQTEDVSVVGLLPRFGVNTGWLNQRAKMLNGLLKGMCAEAEVSFIDVWKVSQRDWVGRDGVHLSRVGNQAVSNLILNGMSKN